MNCGPYSLLWTESQRGNSLTLKEARRLCHTTKDGTYAADLMTALRTLNYLNVRLRENLTWRQLKSLVPKNWVFVTWWTPYDGGKLAAPYEWTGHWSVVKRVTHRTISLYDPDPEEEITLPRQMFEHFWWDFEDENGIRRDFIRSAVVASK